jgi:hypothetical protein
MSIRKFFRAVAAVAVLAAAGSAQAGPISTNTWYNFGFNDTGSALITPFAVDSGFGAIAVPDNGPWTFTLTQSMELFWIDLEISGDRFEFFNFGSSIGTSGADVPNGSSTGTCISCALVDFNYGRGSVILGAGNYSLSGTFLGVIGFGDGAFIVRNVVPEPGSLALIGLALAGLAAVRRRA